jgi:hypothetical protein
VGKGHSLMRTVNKKACQRRQEGRPPPSNLGVGKACNSGCHEKSSTGEGEGHFSMQAVNKQARQRRWVWHHLPQCAWGGEGVQQQLKWGTLHQRVGEGDIHMRTLTEKGLQLQQVGRAAHWRKQKGHASRRTLNKQSLRG